MVLHTDFRDFDSLFVRTFCKIRSNCFRSKFALISLCQIEFSVQTSVFNKLIDFIIVVIGRQLFADLIQRFTKKIFVPAERCYLCCISLRETADRVFNVFICDFDVRVHRASGKKEGGQH